MIVKHSVRFGSRNGPSFGGQYLLYMRRILIGFYTRSRRAALPNKVRRLKMLSKIFTILAVIATAFIEEEYKDAKELTASIGEKVEQAF